MKTIAQNILSQLKQIGEDSFEGGKQAVSDTAGKALEQIGVGGAPKGGATGQKPLMPDAEQKRIKELKIKDQIHSQQLTSMLKKQLDEEIARWRRLREEQIRERRQQAIQAQQAQTEKPPLSPLKEPTPAPKKGIFGLFHRRIKTAREQAQPETAGRRAGG